LNSSELKADFDIIFIQEPSWLTICTIPCLRNCEGESLVSIANHPNWLTFSRVVIYVNFHLFAFLFTKMLLIIKTFFSFCFLTITIFFGWWMFTLIYLMQLWSISRILKYIFEIFWLWQVISTFVIVYGTCCFPIILLLVMILLLQICRFV